MSLAEQVGLFLTVIWSASFTRYRSARVVRSQLLATSVPGTADEGLLARFELNLHPRLVSAKPLQGNGRTPTQVTANR